MIKKYTDEDLELFARAIINNTIRQVHALKMRDVEPIIYEEDEDGTDGTTAELLPGTVQDI